ncbi:bifunctional oligoribonuclease/PAP phosphatase NrnA [Marinoscillum sp. MHG1-6]|uniref:DHH family phosphoesterase n=1 Tax=Marinoscillum sp. MHG1-6 TaxID=2959627 RepID=UPI002157AA7C|nr:bifunctional oligoribonuclease/PAP phosphatase NrnA [Marinoscillum sp. MHG1-6]
MHNIQLLKEFLSSRKKIVITTHASPDADALGSSLGLYLFLKKNGHDVQVISPTEYPEFLFWMPGHDDVIVNCPNSFDHIKELINAADLIACLDFSGYNRIKNLGEVVQNAPGKKLLVDHHLNPEIDADYDVWDQTAAATAELIYDLIEALDGKDDIDVDIAECIYAGIMTDTGSFKFPSTSSKIHRTVAELIDIGADVNKVSRNIYDTNSINRLRFIGYALAEKLTVDENYPVAYFVISADDHIRFNLKSGDTEGLVNYALSIKGMKVSAIIMERDGEIKLSFRSVGDYAVNNFAAEHFDGGGHKNASGGHSEDSLEKTVEKFKSLIPTIKEK